ISFAYSKEDYILHNITLRIARGQMVGIIGPNGAGKSTLIKIILGELRPSKGQVYLQGETIDDFTGWSKIGYLSQKATSFNTSFPASVEEVIAAPLMSNIFLPFMTSKIKKQVQNALELVNLGGYEKSLIGSLSGGQSQRVFLARTLVTEPEIIILDEPFVGIDEKSQQSIAKTLAFLHRKGATIIFVSHDLRWMIDETDLILAVNDTKIKEYAKKSN
ncbi:MAG: metal ABC transporter ATP-binding protein, partial [Clostridia bacterium]|nr:metal ABC transporter ATP-binding protein [Clostridia bacterium]